MKFVAPLIALLTLSAPVAGQTASSTQPEQMPTAPASDYVGGTLFRAPLGPLSDGDALIAYTRDLLAPAIPGLALRPSAAPNVPAFHGEAPSLPDLTVRWWDHPSSGYARSMLYYFMEQLHAGCDDSVLAQHGAGGVRVIVYTASCPKGNEPLQLLWLEAFDRERSRLLMVGTPSADATALRGSGERLLTALGMRPGMRE